MDNTDITAMARGLDDDELLGELRRVAAEADRVPDAVVAAARAAITTRDLDAELAVLLADSAVEPSSDAGVADPLAFDPVRAGPAGVAGSRLLSFAGGGVQVDLEVSQAGDRTVLIGQFSGAAADACVLEYADGRQRVVELDEQGRFLISDSERGPIRFRCRSSTGTRVTTAWVTT